MKLLLTIAFFSLFHSIAMAQQKLGETVYWFGPSIDRKMAEIVADCDCCSEHIIFINGKEFINVYYCESEMSTTKGTYTSSGTKVVLSYEDICVNKFSEDEMGTTYKFEVKKIKPYKRVLSAFSLKGTLFYKTNDKESSYGTLDKSYTVKKIIAELKKEGLWQRLFKKR